MQARALQPHVGTSFCVALSPLTAPRLAWGALGFGVQLWQLIKPGNVTLSRNSPCTCSQAEGGQTRREDQLQGQLPAGSKCITCKSPLGPTSTGSITRSPFILTSHCHPFGLISSLILPLPSLKPPDVCPDCPKRSPYLRVIGHSVSSVSPNG